MSLAIPTLEMIEHFDARTEKHIRLVEKYYENFWKDERSLQPRHDSSKYEEPELLPYIAIAWQYKCKRDEIPFEASDELKRKMNEATNHHIKTNPHHPEFWVRDVEGKNLISVKDRDAIPDNCLDASAMPEDAIVEMCADWCAMSEEKGNTPREWADMVINKRWKFGEEKTELIYEILDEMWK